MRTSTRLDSALLDNRAADSKRAKHDLELDPKAKPHRYRVRDHPLVKVIGIFNSGQLNSNVIAKSLTKPAFYFLGGPSDIAYKNVSRPVR